MENIMGIRDFQDLDLENFKGTLSNITPCSPNDLSPAETQRWQQEVHAYLRRPRDIRQFLKSGHQILLRSFGLCNFAYILCRNSEDVLKNVWSWPEVSRDLYVTERLSRYDIMLNHVMRSEQGILQGDIVRQCSLLSFQHEIFHFNTQIYAMVQSLGMLDYYNFGFNPACSIENRGFGRAVLSIGAVGMSEIEFHARIRKYEYRLQLFGRIFDHIGYYRKFGFTFQNPVFETLRGTPRRVLDALANKNINVTQVANELNLSPRTVAQALDDARTELDVPTNIRAVVEALKHGLISLRE
jgi:hypothetical protein